VPAGSVAVGNLADWQCTPLTFWPDGSLKHAICAGRANCAPNVERVITLSVGAPLVAPALTEADLLAALPTVTVAVGSHTTTLNSLVGTSARHRTVCSGPIMSNWIYREAVAGSSHLVIWIDVRLYKGGAIEIFPWVENCYFLVPGPTNVVRTCSVTIAGVQRFSQSIDIKHHTRVALVAGNSFSYWVGADPQITPKHDGAYLRATKLVPNYGWYSPSTTTLNALTTAYTPNFIGNVDAAMGNAGTRPGLLEHWQAFYVTTSGDVRAYRAMIANGLASGSWSIHYRDERTNEPFKFAAYPLASLSVPESPAIPAGSGPTNGNYAVTHHPCFAYLPFLITARWFFLEELLFQNSYHYLLSDTIRRRQASGIFFCWNGAYTTRGAGWALRTCAQTLALLPTSHPCHSDLVNQWEQNMIKWRDHLVNGEPYSDQYTTNRNWSNALGVPGHYTDYNADNSRGSAFWTGPWQEAFVIQAVGHAWDLGLPISASARTAHQQVRDYLYKFVVGLAGDGAAGGFNYRYFGVYDVPIGTKAGGNINYYSSWGAAYQEWLAQTPSADRATAPGLSLRYGSGDATAFDLTEGFIGQKIPALAYAVEHGASGAAAAWARITGSTTWGLAGAFSDAPKFGVVPR